MGRLNDLTIVAALVAFCVSAVDGKVYTGLQELHSSKDSYDFIVVGGGVGGSVLASRLSEDKKHNVLLVEAGVDNEGVTEIAVPGYWPRIFNTSLSWGDISVPQAGLNNRALLFPTGKVLGGSSSLNGMVYTRGSSDDYDLWGKLSGDSDRWSWKKIFPYFIRNEKFVSPAGGRNTTGQYDPQYHGFKGKTSVSLPSSFGQLDQLSLQNAAAQTEIKFNLDTNSGKPLGLGSLQFTIGNGERCSAAVAYLSPEVRQRPNLDIVINTYASRVLPSSTKPQDLDIRTVEVAPTSGGKKTTFTARRELILTAGAFGTPRILLNSGIGDKAELAKVNVKTIHHLPDVGTNLIDHVAIRTPAWSTNAPAYPIDYAAAFQQWQTNRTGPLTESFGHQVIFARIPSNASLWNDHRDPSSGPTSPHLELVPLPNGTTLNFDVVVVSPQSRGSVKIRSNNPSDPLIVDPGYFTHPFDALAIEEGIKIVKRWLQGPAFKDYVTGFIGPDPDRLPRQEFSNEIKEVAGVYGHPVGTARMSPRGAKHGVLDPDLKVKGVRGLRVVDASAFPYIPSGHTQVPVYALSERASDFIKEAWK